jgi:hypothetical protein
VIDATDVVRCRTIDLAALVIDEAAFRCAMDPDDPRRHFPHHIRQ